ncbi:Uncharacterised protein [Mycobacteroides abscessus subsp. bolletii]|nr:Uncharacterised protein [Mycobacteroides abscessus subsp. bolletii]SLC78897.1 Uncharacterised protein [Mycobacteroides abscessus subsp. massiliense]
MTSQCAQPTVRNLFILVWATTSTTSCLRRGRKGRKRVRSGWPERITRTIFTTPPKNDPHATRLKMTPMIPSVIVAVLTVLTSRSR